MDVLGPLRSTKVFLLTIVGVLTAVSALTGFRFAGRSAERLRAGEGEVFDLMDYTGIVSYAEMLKLPGVAPRGRTDIRFDGSYFASLPRTRLTRFFDSDFGDVLTLIAVLAVLLFSSSLTLSLWIIAVASAYQLAGWIYCGYAAYQLCKETGWPDEDSI